MKSHSSTQLKNDILNHLNRPENHIERLIQMVCETRTPTTICKKKKICLTRNSERQCLVLLKGSVSLCRISDGMVLNAECAPFIFGANTQLAYAPHLYVKVKETTDLLLLPQREFYNEVSEHALWQSLSMLQDYTAAKVYAHCLTVSQLSAYEIIRSHLNELMNESDELRNNITAAHYIMDHSFLSRSGVMHILAKLKDEGYIHLSRGVLKDVINLPEQLNMLYSRKPRSFRAEP